MRVLSSALVSLDGTGRVDLLFDSTMCNLGLLTSSYRKAERVRRERSLHVVCLAWTLDSHDWGLISLICFIKILEW
jgi:hypothetical protein